MEVQMNIPKLIEDLVWTLRITKKELSKRIGISSRTLTNWSNKIGEPRASEYEKMREMLANKDGQNDR